ncbi:MAG TPA: serine/threonine-protein kinase [Planctomycetota bacterium]|nr:serine/threonine-protein kinase [Planctomycetota bacterium]
MSDTTAGAAKSDYTFGQIAIRENICTFEQVKECLDIQSKLRTLGIEPKKLGEILIEKGYLTPEQAVALAKSQVATVASASSSKLSIPGYELISRIGQGAMGTVFKAKQVSMDRVVAIKVLSSKYSKDRVFVERFLREARAVAKLNHENIISGYDVGEANGHHYFVMEFVDGAPVTALMKREGRIDEQKCLRIGIQVARALAHAHKHGIVHRDIKPENVMLTATGGAKLCDLGLAKQTKGDAEVTMDGTSVGTPNYISPEQARGEEKIDIRSDIYSLGASLYHMAVGAPPFSGANPMVVMTKHVTEFAEPPKRRCPTLSDGYSGLVMKMMQKRREDRPQDPEALIHDLEKLLNGEPLAAAAAPRAAAPVVSRPITHHTHTPRTHPSSTVLPAARATSSSGLVFASILGVAAIVGAIVFLTRGDGKPEVVTANPGPKPNPPTTNPSAIDAAERAKKSVQQFRELWDPQLTDASKPERYTEPYATILKMIDRSKSASDFAAQKVWMEELSVFTGKVNTLISTKIWAPIRSRADAPFSNGDLTKAAEELSKLEDVYKYFRNDDKVERTQAGREHQEYLAKIDKRRDDDYLNSKMQADLAFKDPKQRDDAYKLLDAAARDANAEQRESIEKARSEYLQRDVAEAMQGGGPDAGKRALDRIAALRRDHAKNPGAVKLLDEMGDKIRADVRDASTAAVSEAMRVYTGSFRSGFDDALKRRDLSAARKSLFDIYFASSPQLQTLFLPASTDNAALRGYLDASRVTAADTHKIVVMAEEGIKFTALRSSQYEAARELYVDLRITALLEELLDQAGAGALAVSRDAARFKAGFSSPLSNASSAEPAPRKAGEGQALSLSVGAQKLLVPLSPAGKLSLPEDDIVALARRAPGAASDPKFPLKAFYLYVFADRGREAKDWLDKLVSAESRIGTERYVDRFKGMTSAREEDEAKKLFQDAGDLYFRKKDTAGGAKKFKECLERYSGTEYMKAKVLPSNRTRIEIAQDMFGGGDGKPKGMRPAMRELFAGAEVKDLGRGRYEVTYSGFKDDKELTHFAVADGQVQLARLPGGLGMQGTGLVHWNVPLKGNVSVEVSFRPVGDGAFGLFLHADGNRSGFLAVADLPVPGQSLDAIFRMPIGEGDKALASLVAQGGTGIQLQKNAANTALFSKDGSKLHFTLNRGELNGDSAAFNEGKAGIAVLNTGIVVDRVKVIGEIDAAWLETELKRIEGR